MEQKNITRWLKAATIAIGLLGLVFFGGFTLYAFKFKPDYNDSIPMYIRQNIFLVWLTALFCYLILFFFWRIINEIGKDNSFSMENVTNFKKMAFCGGMIGFQYLIRILIWFVEGNLNLIAISYTLLKIIVFIIFDILCIAMSKLVQNAYEIKQENDLTI